MSHQWLISELEGLRDYAALNGLPALAEHLDQARLLALTEIAGRGGGDCTTTPAAAPGAPGTTAPPAAGHWGD